MQTILIVEDNKAYQELYSEFFLEKKYRVIQAFTGDEGMKKLIHHNPDVLILDLAIPGLSGRSLLMEIKRHNKNLPVFIVSGRVGMQSDPEIELCSQVKGFFEKPVPMDKLLEEIIKVVPQIPTETPLENKGWIGKKIQGCTIAECIGRGGTGVVYKAKRGKIDVVIKILYLNKSHAPNGQEAEQNHTETVEFDDTEERIARFQREGKILTQIAHPNIISLYDAGLLEGDTYFIIMEYFDGHGLDILLDKERRIPLKEAINIVEQIAEGMLAAHKKDLIQRDLKPSNILYNRQAKCLKIIDFGSARAIKVEQTLTQQGYVVGTPLYMSPEQCLGSALDHRSDIYSLGVIFFQLITGALPFIKDGAMQILFAHVYEAFEWPPQYRYLAPLGIQNMIYKMLDKSKDKRYPSMFDFLQDLKKIKQEIPS
ncbi:MAG: protein kinase [Candidatus Brocadiae bacterium]|nr:protein kinase [Candidatus Brocadiia bacterium]